MKSLHMRLSHVEDNGELSLVEYMERDIPPYGILSHPWGADMEEVTYEKLMQGVGKNKAGDRKISFCAKQASKEGLRFFWVDTCCINKENKAELSYAINLCTAVTIMQPSVMFTWQT